MQKRGIWPDQPAAGGRGKVKSRKSKVESGKQKSLPGERFAASLAAHFPMSTTTASTSATTTAAPQSERGPKMSGADILVAALERRGIAQLGATSATETQPTEFRSVRHNPERDVVDTGTPDIEVPSVADSFRSEQSAPSVSTTDSRVNIGDRVIVRYADGNGRSLAVQIVADGTANGRDRISPRSPLGAAILGLRVEDETDVVIDGRQRTVMVQEIQQSQQDALTTT